MLSLVDSVATSSAVPSSDVDNDDTSRSLDDNPVDSEVRLFDVVVDRECSWLTLTASVSSTPAEIPVSVRVPSLPAKSTVRPVDSAPTLIAPVVASCVTTLVPVDSMLVESDAMLSAVDVDNDVMLFAVEVDKDAKPLFVEVDSAVMLASVEGDKDAKPLFVEVDNDAMLPLVDVDNEARLFAAESDNDAMSPAVEVDNDAISLAVEVDSELTLLAVDVDSEFSCDMLTASVDRTPAATPLSNMPSVAFDIVNTLPFAPPVRK
ncbi:hypothetical protein BvRS1_13820 [Burkholderia vietnamiensis]|nr:hypothetical protein BvRS1_13820 [Burkholderia vietnamiensis]